MTTLDHTIILLTSPAVVRQNYRTIMVEGPGATRNGRKAQAAVGHKVESLALSSTCDASKSTALQDSLVGLILCEAFSVGKEVFLIFTPDYQSSGGHNDDDSNGDCAGPREEVAVRLHFGMNGCLYCAKSISVPQWKKKQEATICMALVKPIRTTAIQCKSTITNIFDDTKPAASAASAASRIFLEARESTVSGVMSARAARSKLERLASRDSCSSSFDARQVFTVLRDAGAANPSLMICDSVLNQDLFPGVGNIIKVESLHLSKVHPRRAVSTLSDAELRRVVSHCRKYSIEWLERGRAPNKMVYNQTKCGTCNNKSVSMQKMGGGPKMNGSNHAYMSRTTFWCRLCQPCNGVSGSNAVHSSNNDVQSASAPPMPTITIACPQHGGCLLKRVRKSDSPNLNRLFRICKVRQCQYFAWADGGFPSCRCGRKAILRVSKTERSGGRWFLSCAKGDRRGSSNSDHGCGFFEWAKPEVLTPLGPALTPLL